MPSLHDPLTLPNGQVLPNRIMKSALSEALADRNNSPDHRLSKLYERWSTGGYGLIITGNVMVDRRQLGEPDNVVIEDERDLDALSRWAKTTQDAGVPIWAQLNHPGRQSSLMAVRHTPVAPSAVALNLPGATTPRELTGDEIEDIIDRFATAAVVCETAGFNGVQVHGAHGYLVNQFLSPLSNLRTDEWGGDPERRMRFPLEVVRRIRSRVSPGFAVAIKLNSADFQRGGFTEDESRGVLAALAGEGLDMIEISGGSYESPAMMGTAAASTRAREAYFLEYAQTVREVVGDVPLAVTGGFRSRTGMDSAVASRRVRRRRHRAPDSHHDRFGIRDPRRTRGEHRGPQREVRHAPRPGQGRGPQAARRHPRPELAHRSAPPPRRRPRARPESRSPGHGRRHGAPQRPRSVPSHAGLNRSVTRSSTGQRPLLISSCRLVKGLRDAARVGGFPRVDGGIQSSGASRQFGCKGRHRRESAWAATPSSGRLRPTSALQHPLPNERPPRHHPPPPAAARTGCSSACPPTRRFLPMRVDHRPHASALGPQSSRHRASACRADQWRCRQPHRAAHQVPL